MYISFINRDEIIIYTFGLTFRRRIIALFFKLLCFRNFFNAMRTQAPVINILLQ